jgi:nucleotide-binding universal stress UspA family protein
MKVKPTSKSSEVLMELGLGDEALIDEASGQPSPFQIKNILVPMDFSACAEKALRYAMPLAEQNAAAITLLHVLPSYVTGGLSTVDYVQLRGEMRASAESQLSALAAQEGKENVEIRFRTAEGDAATEIIAGANTLRADLIVISTHGRTGLTHALLGSVAEHVVRRAPCPVLVVREREHEFLQSPVKTT